MSNLHKFGENFQVMELLESFTEADVKAFEDLCASDADLQPRGSMDFRCPVCESEFRFRPAANLHVREAHPWFKPGQENLAERI